MPRFVRRGPTVPFRSARRQVSLEGPRGIGGTEPPVPPRRSSGPACLRAFSVWLHLRNRADFPARPSVPSAMRAARPPSPQNATKSSEASLTTPAPTAEVGSTFHAAQNLHPPHLHLVEASRFNLEGREDVEAGKLRLYLREFGRNAASRDARGNGGKREDKAETAEFFFDGHGLFSQEDSTPESREEDPPPFSFLWRSRRPKNTGGGDIRHAESGDESDRRVSLNVLPDPARCLAGSDYQARN